MTFLDAYKRAGMVLVKKPIMLWGLSLLTGVMSIIASLVTLPFGVVGTVFNSLVTCGMAKVYIDGLAGKAVNSDQLFACFNSRFLRVAGGMAWRSLWIIIWCLIPIAGPIIACIKAYSYAFVPYILITQPEVSATEALRLSMRMTKGKKGQMFLADLCLYGSIFVVVWILTMLSVIPFIGLIFGLANFIVIVLTFLFSSIFKGLYAASFYTDATDTVEVNE